MSTYDVVLASEADAGAFRLLELPPELLALVEAGASTDASGAPPLSIKGLPGDDAVLCTASRTYALRGVVLSNSVLVLSPPCRADADALPAAPGSSAGTEHLLIRDTLHEILEVAPCLPRVHTLGARLRGAEYSEDEDEDLYGDEDAPAPTKKGAKPFTYADALHTIQASPAELDAALAAQHILNLNGTLRPLAPAYLARILQLTLALLVAAGWAPGGAGAPAGELARTLEAEHGVRREVATQVMAWFGGVEGDVWSVDVDAVVREVGLGVLRTYQNERVEEDVYMDKWKDAVGDAFADRVALSLLPGDHLVHPPAASTFASPRATVQYFPRSALPRDPAGRLGDLFATRVRWRPDDIAPFLDDICLDAHERERLLLKYARAVSGPDGVWLTGRTL